MKLPSLLTTLLAAVFVFVASNLGAKEPQAIPGEHRLNAVLEQLTAAQSMAAKDPQAAIARLQEASVKLAKGKTDTNPYQMQARELTEKATRHLEKGKIDAALRAIGEAIDAVNKIGPER